MKNISSPKFTRVKENFVCEHCGYQVQGNGYTDHCPKCLCSLHVDNFPGDRANACRGQMRPLGLETANRKTQIVYECLRCGVKKKNKVSPNDDLSQLL